MSGNRNRREDRRPPAATASVVAPRAQAAPAAPKPDLQQQFLVVIQNMMTQVLEVSVLDEGGNVTGLRLEPRGKSRPILVDRVGQRTHELVAAGRARIVPQS
jgi:hypothetical protein